MTNNIDYIALIQRFLSREMSVYEFEEKYFSMFGDDRRNFSISEYEVLNGLFTDIDCFDPDEIVTYGDSLSEEDLRESARRALLALRNLTEN